MCSYSGKCTDWEKTLWEHAPSAVCSTLVTPLASSAVVLEKTTEGEVSLSWASSQNTAATVSPGKKLGKGKTLTRERTGTKKPLIAAKVRAANAKHSRLQLSE